MTFVEEDMENYWIVFDNVKDLKDWTTLTCHLDRGVLIIACCDMHFEDGATQIVFWDNLNVVVAENGVSKVNFRGFMAINAQANWNAMGRIYWYNDSNMPMVKCECTCSFHWFVSLDKVTQKYNRPSLHFQNEQICL